MMIATPLTGLAVPQIDEEIQEPNHDHGLRLRCDPIAWQFCLVCIFWLSRPSPTVFQAHSPAPAWGPQ